MIIQIYGNADEYAAGIDLCDSVSCLEGRSQIPLGSEGRFEELSVWQRTLIFPGFKAGSDSSHKVLFCGQA